MAGSTLKSIGYNEILKEEAYIKTPFVVSKKDKNFEIYGYHEGIDLQVEADKREKRHGVYSISSGVVIQRSEEDVEKGLWSVIIQYDGFYSLRYANLEEPAVESGQVVEIGEEIGKYHNWVHFEFLTAVKPDDIPVYAVRVDDLELYKQDPMKVIEGEILLDAGNIEEMTDEVSYDLALQGLMQDYGPM